jgi:phytoene dehydrogenase-like protein
MRRPGAAVGIDVTPQRFTDPVILQQLDVATKIPNLYMTGQDTVLCGVTLCQVLSCRATFSP